MPAKQVRHVCFVDGFNLYHAIKEHRHLGNSCKWLNVWKLAERFVQPRTDLVRVVYFSACATWRPASVMRHKIYMEALRANFVEVKLGRFVTLHPSPTNNSD